MMIIHRAIAFVLSTTMILQAQEPGAIGPPATPSRSRGTGGGCQFSGPLIRVPSATSAGEGLVVRLSPPAEPRYPKGAPVAVHLISTTARVDGSLACFSEAGFVDVGFLCPGSAYRQPDGSELRSGGRTMKAVGPKADCIEALADVVAFATGRARSTDGKLITDYLPAALADDAGVVGWSMGGNLATFALGRFGERFPALRWYASWESPFDDRQGDFGHAVQANPFYDPSTNKVNFETLRYSNAVASPMWPPIFTLPVKGALFLDGNKDAEFNRDTDFLFHPQFEPGPPPNLFYSPLVTREAGIRRVFGEKWPAEIATEEQVAAHEREQDPVPYARQAVRKLPNLAVLVYESGQHHVVDGADHWHAIKQYQGWLKAGARWVRFNPDDRYVEAIVGKPPAAAISNPARRRVDSSSIARLLEPEASEGGPTDKEGMAAAVCELADRTWTKEWSPELRHVLHVYRR